MTPLAVPLALEWIKALAAPAAALIAAVAALVGFRYQRRLDRRLDWYREMVRALGDTQAAAERASRLGAPVGAGEQTNAALDHAIALSVEGLMYVQEKGAAALVSWWQAVFTLPGRAFDSEASKVIADAAANAIADLVDESRASLGLGKLLGRNKWLRTRAGDDH